MHCSCSTHTHTYTHKKKERMQDEHLPRKFLVGIVAANRRTLLLRTHTSALHSHCGFFGKIIDVKRRERENRGKYKKKEREKSTADERCRTKTNEVCCVDNMPHRATRFSAVVPSFSALRSPCVYSACVRDCIGFSFRVGRRVNDVLQQMNPH
jgi:hypothetical protein